MWTNTYNPPESQCRYPQIKAFLLTRQSFDRRDGVQLVLWFRSEAGPIKVEITQQQVLFFIRQSDAPRAAELLTSFPKVEIKPLALKDFEGETMAGVYFPAQQQLYQARDLLQQQQIRCLEADIRAPERFLSERFLTGPVTLHTESLPSNHTLVNPRITPDEYTPQLAVMSLDIETDYASDALYSIAFVCGETKRVLMIDPTHQGDDEALSIEYVSDEKTLLRRFLHWVEQLDPDLFIGWNVINFDFRFLQNKADQLRIPLTLGRQRSKAVWRQQQGDGERYFLLIPGRVVLDGIDTLKSATYNFASFSLESVASELLGRGKLIQAEDHHDPLYKAKEIRRQFHEDKHSLAKYNLEDCQLVWEIFETTHLVAFALERARLTGLELDRVGGSVAAFENLYLPRLHRKGYIAPNIGDYHGGLSAPGGYVMDSLPGMHESVLVLDYKSLYPSIIRTFKVDPYARIAAQQQTEEETIPGYDGATFSKQESILPALIEQLWEARDRAKQQHNPPLSQAIKIIMNSFYGVLGTPGCRLHDSRLTSSITKRGHDVILKSVELIETQGYQVIYGDTDSVFVALGKRVNNTEADKIGNTLTSLINHYWQETLQQQYGIDSYLEMEYETHYQRFFMPTIRGSEKGSKKRYAGMKVNEQGQQQLIFKGLESVRTDWTALAREFQQNLYQRVFNHQAYEEYIRMVVSELKAGKHDDKLIYRKRLRQRLRDYQRNIPPHAQAAKKAEAIFQQQNQPSRYQNASWIEYVMTLNGPETLECHHSPLDYEHYISKQLTPIADTILSTLGSSMERVINDQFELPLG